MIGEAGAYGHLLLAAAVLALLTITMCILAARWERIDEENRERHARLRREVLRHPSSSDERNDRTMRPT